MAGPEMQGEARMEVKQEIELRREAQAFRDRVLSA